MIKLPHLFEVKLGTSAALAEAVKTSFDTFEPWLEQSGMPFFPGFTDHSPRHISDVLQTAASLISDRGHELISAEDVTVLCIAILLHDCGMHLTQDGFRTLISNSGPSTVSGLGDRPWSQLWGEFLSEAQRFSEERLIGVFGDSQPIDVRALDVNDLSERDCLLVGEFVRRHHARLAHEIALSGVPTPSNSPLKLVQFDRELRDLAGLVARSHGMSIRATFPYLSERYGLIGEYRKVKTPYLMCVLRIADYVQVQSERALKSLLSVKELRSPISRQEWSNHFSVKDVSTRHEDPEAMYVHATPVDVRTYLRLDSLFRDIQKEMDQSWAVLGEVYGRVSDLSNLGLTIRRIVSNLDSKERFSRTVSYIPIRAGFSSSGPELLKLLVGPLYDYECSVGIRELIQNSVDACRERADLDLGEVPTLNTVEPEVIVKIFEGDDGCGWVTVTDQGVGMTLETITRYCLVAGASFRNSEVWKRQHITDDGEIRVVRGGRFGVGALAAFLLGSEIHVRTRHVSCREDEGIEFTARMDDPIVELRRCLAPVGTSIRVLITDPKVCDQLRPEAYDESQAANSSTVVEGWPAVDWLAQSYPRLRVEWDGLYSQYGVPPARISCTFQPKYRLVPADERNDSAGWNRLCVATPYKAIFWSFPEKEIDEGGFTTFRGYQVVVNGIRVESYFPGNSSRGHLKISREARLGGPRFDVSRPSLAIFDPSGVCPINLQRSAVAFDQMGLDEALASEIVRHFFPSLREYKIPKLDLKGLKEFGDRVRSSESIAFTSQVGPIAVSRDGIFLASPNNFEELGIHTLFFVTEESDATTDEGVSTKSLPRLLRKGEALMVRVPASGTQARLAWFRQVLSEYTSVREAATRAFGWGALVVPLLDRVASVSISATDTWEIAKKKGKVRAEIVRSITMNQDSEGRTVLSSGDAEAADVLIARVRALYSSFSGAIQLDAWALDQKQTLSSSQNLLHEMWMDAFKATCIN